MNENPNKDEAKILFVIFAFFMAMYILFSFHMRHTYAQESTDEITKETSNEQNVVVITKPEQEVFVDPFLDFYDEVGEDPLIGIYSANMLHKEVDYRFATDNPYFKPNYDFNWRAHHEYNYFVWLESKRHTKKELEQIEYEKILLQREMTEAVLHNLIQCIKTVDNSCVLNPYCEKDVFGCRERIFALVGYIVNVSYDLNLDPWLLAAIAFHESNFNPFAVGPVGERGYFQINPNTHIGKKNKFVRSRWYREQCRKKLGNCQEEVAQAGAVHIYKDIKRCEGSIPKALTRYNTGRCLINGSVRKVYVRSVLNFKAQLQNGKPEQPWCEPDMSGKTTNYSL